MPRSVLALLAGLALLLGPTLFAPAAAADESTGVLHLSARPECRVWIDGVDHGTTEDTRQGIDMAPGTYRVRFICQHEDCEGFERRSGIKTLAVEAGRRTRYVADLYALNGRESDRAAGPTPTDQNSLDPLPDRPRTDDGLGPLPTAELTPSATRGVMYLSSRPRVAVEVDGRFVGTTDRTRLGLEVEPGTHRVRFLCEEDACAEFERRSGVKTIEVVAGETVRYVADFFALNSRRP